MGEARSLRLPLSWMEVVLVVAAPFRRLYFRLMSFFLHPYFFQSVKSLHESFTSLELLALKMRLTETIQKQVRGAWVTEVHWVIIIDVGCDVEVVDAELEAA